MGGGWLPPHMVGMDHSLAQQHAIYHNPHMEQLPQMYYDMDSNNAMHQDTSHLQQVPTQMPQTAHLQPAQTTTLPPVSQALPPGT